MPIWSRFMVDTERGQFELFTAGHGSPMCVTHHYSEYNVSGDRFAEQFLPYRQVFLVNLKGAGQSTGADTELELSMKEAVEDLEAIRIILGFPTWDFAGHSTGGMLGLLYAVVKGKSVSSLTVVGAAASREYNWTKECIYHPDHPEFPRMKEIAEMQKKPDISPDERVRLTQEATKLSLFRPERYSEYFSGSTRKSIVAKRLDYFIKHDYPQYDLRDQLSQIHARCLILCGRYDVQCPLWCSVEMHQLIPTSEFHIFEQSNHYPFLEERTIFNQVIGSFLS